MRPDDPGGTVLLQNTAQPPAQHTMHHDQSISPSPSHNHDKTEPSTSSSDTDSCANSSSASYDLFNDNQSVRHLSAKRRNDSDLQLAASSLSLLDRKFKLHSTLESESSF